MKNIVRNDLWMMIVAWCLLLNDYSFLALIVTILASIYLFFNVRYKKYWRVIAICFVCFSLSYLFIQFTAFYTNSLCVPFLGGVSVNVSLLNERIQKERMASLFPKFMIMFICFIIFTVIAFFIPNYSLLSNAKTNILSLIILIFIPYTSEILINLLIKEYNMKRFLDKVKTRKTSKMYN